MSKQFDYYLQDEMIEDFVKGFSASAIARKMKLHTTSVTRVLKRNGLKMTDGKGQNHSQWKGGRGIKSGYWAVYNPTHPRALNNGRVFEHILIAEKKYGRSISKTEVIHHIDLDRLNNNPDNLLLLQNNREHQLLHGSLDKVVSGLIKKGVIKFKKGKYQE